MVNIADLKNYILEEQQIEPILEELGCHHISHKPRLIILKNLRR